MSGKRVFRGAGRGGRGAYYKNLYGRGGRGRNTGEQSSQLQSPSNDAPSPADDILSRGPAPLGRVLGNRDFFERKLKGIDGKSYGAYRDLKGVWDFGTFLLSLDRIQVDPFAPPSKARVRVSRGTAGFPLELFKNKSRNIALADYITRQVHQVITSRGYHRGQQGEEGWSGPRGGDFRIDSPGQQILQRSSVLVNAEWVEARISISLPAQGRTVLGGEALKIFTSSLPFVIERSLLASAYDLAAVNSFVESVEDQDFLRSAIIADSSHPSHETNLDHVAFIPNGAILPRESGASDKPLQSSSVVPFQSPPSLQKTYNLPNKGLITGMVIPAGITTIVGGGFHGKSTLLRAISLGVGNHIPGDGREYIVTNPTAVPVRSEDGRSVSGVDISPFISDLPGGVTTTKWNSDDASGSTSMAAGVIEVDYALTVLRQACELGSQLLLFDEDLCATNFMIRDEIMRTLVKREPITPLIDRIRGLDRDKGVSSILVVGGCSDYLIAPLVIKMEDYRAIDITQDAHAFMYTSNAYLKSFDLGFSTPRDRSIVAATLCNPSDRPPKPRSLTTIQISRSGPNLELSALSQLVHTSQTRLISEALYFLSKHGNQRNLNTLVNDLIGDWEEGMLSGDGGEEGWLAAVRAIDLGMAINRIRGLKVA